MLSVMSDIVICTLNARYWHSAFGLRYLLANMGALREQTTMLEFGIKDNSLELLSAILEHKPKIVGIGVYIWNVEPATRLVEELKRVAPEVTVVLGGPEVSYETDGQRIVEAADYVVCGEGDVAFPALCEQLLSGLVPVEKVVHATPPKFDQLTLPYELYDDEDIAHRVIYVEVSRGCPFTCEFCLSALDIPVRLADVDEFLNAMQRLLDRGAKQFKFVDRTFNLNIRVSKAILQFFLDRYTPGMFLHFEMIPDRLPDDLRRLIAEFPAGSLQFEIGVQTFNDDVGDRISRAQDNAQLETNFRFLRNETGVHIHSDLIVGLPGESVASFGCGFDRLIALQPQEIQVGILKRLKGTPITRHDEEWQMVYSPHPPYEILSTSEISFAEMQRMRRFARYWDLIGNSGNFLNSMPLLLGQATSSADETPTAFARVLAFSDWLYAKDGKLHGIPLAKLTERIFDFLCELGVAESEAAVAVWRDYVGGGRKDKPSFLREFELPHHLEVAKESPSKDEQVGETAVPPRQARHAQA